MDLVRRLAAELARLVPDEARAAAALAVRPARKRTITDRLNVMLSERVIDQETGKATDRDWGDLVAMALLKEAVDRKGKNAVTAQKEILDRVDGPKETRVTGAGGGPLVFAPKMAAVDPALMKRGETPPELLESNGSGDPPPAGDDEGSRPS